MTTFNKREEGFEQQFAHDEEFKFKTIARRNKLLGLWAAEKLGLTGARADSYPLSLVMSGFEDAGEHDVASQNPQGLRCQGRGRARPSDQPRYERADG